MLQVKYFPAILALACGVSLSVPMCYASDFTPLSQSAQNADMQSIFANQNVVDEHSSELLELEREQAKQELANLTNQSLDNSFKEQVARQVDHNILNTPRRQGFKEFSSVSDTINMRMVARQAEQDFRANSADKFTSNVVETKSAPCSHKSDWGQAVDLSTNRFVLSEDVLKSRNFGVDNVANRRISRADEQDVRDGKRENHLSEFMIATDYGQDLIGQICLDEYVKRWKEQIALQVEEAKAQGKQFQCKVFANAGSATILGRDCLQSVIFERIEARSDESGTLVSLMLVEQLTPDTTAKDVRYFLSKRYQDYDVSESELANIAEYEADLCFLMTKMVEDKYKCDVSWYTYAGNQMIYKYSEYGDKKRAIYIFGSADYFQEVEKILVKKRLALVRQDLERRGVFESSLAQEKEAFNTERERNYRPYSMYNSNTETVSKLKLNSSL